MTERERTPELYATAEQTQTIIEEVMRITDRVETLPGLTRIKNHSAPTKIRWHNDMLFIYYPEGETNVDDQNVMNIASVSWDNPDGSRSSYRAELTPDDQLQLAKHTYPPTDGSVKRRSRITHNALRRGDYRRVMFNTSMDLIAANQDRAMRVEERSLGLHRASLDEATDLIEKLQRTEPAPKERFL